MSLRMKLVARPQSPGPAIATNNPSTEFPQEHVSDLGKGARRSPRAAPRPWCDPHAMVGNAPHDHVCEVTVHCEDRERSIGIYQRRCWPQVVIVVTGVSLPTHQPSGLFSGSSAVSHRHPAEPQNTPCKMSWHINFACI